MLNISGIIGKFVKNSSQREIDRLKSIIEKINELESKIKDLPDNSFPSKTLEFKERYDQFCDAGTQACAETDGNTQTPLDANKKMKNSRNVVQTSGNPSVLYAFDDEGSDGQLTSVKPNLLGWMMAGIVGAAAIGFIGGHSAKGSKRNGLS